MRPTSRGWADEKASEWAFKILHHLQSFELSGIPRNLFHSDLAFVDMINLLSYGIKPLLFTCFLILKSSFIICIKFPY